MQQMNGYFLHMIRNWKPDNTRLDAFAFRFKLIYQWEIQYSAIERGIEISIESPEMDRILCIDGMSLIYVWAKSRA